MHALHYLVRNVSDVSGRLMSSTDRQRQVFSKSSSLELFTNSVTIISAIVMRDSTAQPSWSKQGCRLRP